jgi:hypothetical protein
MYGMERTLCIRCARMNVSVFSISWRNWVWALSSFGFSNRERNLVAKRGLGVLLVGLDFGKGCQRYKAS